MKVPLKLGLFGVGLVAVFTASCAIASAVVPSYTAAAWSQSTEGPLVDDADTQPAATVTGLSVEQDGLLLGEVSSPATPAPTPASDPVEPAGHSDH